MLWLRFIEQLQLRFIEQLRLWLRFIEQLCLQQFVGKLKLKPLRFVEQLQLLGFHGARSPDRSDNRFGRSLQSAVDVRLS